MRLRGTGLVLVKVILVSACVPTLRVPGDSGDLTAQAVPTPVTSASTSPSPDSTTGAGTGGSSAGGGTAQTPGPSGSASAAAAIQVTGGAATGTSLTLVGKQLQSVTSIRVVNSVTGGIVGTYQPSATNGDGTYLTAVPTSAFSLLAGSIYSLFIASANAAEATFTVTFSGTFNSPLVISAATPGAAPANTGTAQSGSLVSRFTNSTVNSTLDFGAYASQMQWIQASKPTDLSVSHPILLNPNGGNVGIGITSAPVAALEVGGGITASGAITTGGVVSGANINAAPIQSTKTFASRFVLNTSAGVDWTGEQITITVPSGASRYYRIYIRQMFMRSGAGQTSDCGVYLSTSKTSLAGLPSGASTLYLHSAMPQVWIQASAEGFLYLAPGSYTYYVVASCGAAGTQYTFANQTSDSSVYSNVIAWPM